jgi:hypothetical protein
LEILEGGLFLKKPLGFQVPRKSKIEKAAAAGW